MHLAENSKSGTNVRILHVTAVPETAVVIVKPLAVHQLAMGYAVEFACAMAPIAEKLTEAGIAVHHVPFKRKLLSFHHVIAFFKLVQLLRRGRYDVVHAHTPVAAFIARIAARTAGVPVIIYHLRGSFWEHPSRLVRTFYSLLEWVAARTTTYTLTINCIDREELIRRRIFPADRVTCLHSGGSGLDVQRFAPENVTSEQQHEISRQLGIGPGELIIGYVGRLVWAKGILNLLDAFETLLATHPEAKLLLVGSTLATDRDQGLQKFIERRMAERNFAHRVILAGQRSDIPALLSLTDILVLPSYHEGFGMVLAEAMAMARPVVATATRGAREIISDGLTGRLVPIADTGALTSALVQLAGNPDLRERMGRAGREAVIRHHSMDRVCAEIDSIYARLLESHRVTRLQYSDSRSQTQA